MVKVPAIPKPLGLQVPCEEALASVKIKHNRELRNLKTASGSSGHSLAMATAEAIFAQVGAKGFHSKADIENYVAAFNVDDFASYFQYYAPDIFVSFLSSTAGQLHDVMLKLILFASSMSALCLVRKT